MRVTSSEVHTSVAYKASMDAMGTPSRRDALHSPLHPPDTAEVWVRYKTGGQKRDLGVGKKKFFGDFYTRVLLLLIVQ